MHPLIKQYLTTRLSIPQIFDKHPEVNDEPITEAIKLISSKTIEDLKGLENNDDWQVAIDFDLDRSSTNELSILYLIYLQSLFSNTFNSQGNNIYLQKGLGLITTNTNNTIKALIYAKFAVCENLNYSEQQEEQYLKLSDKALKFKYYRDYEIMINHRFLKSAFNGTLYLLKNKVNDLKKRISTSTLSKEEKTNLLENIQQGKFFNSVTRGDIKKTKIDFSKIKVSTARIQRFMVYMYLQQGINDPKDWHGVKLYKKESNIPLWIKIDQSLARKKPQQALKYAKLMTSQENVIISNTHIHLIRAELANKDIQASEWLINKWKARTSADNLLMICQFRLELLKKNMKKATELFIKAAKLHEHYHWQGIFDYSLKLAIEINPKDLKILREKATQSTYIHNSIKDKTTIIELPKEIIIGNSKETVLLRKTIKEFSNLDAPVLITGETGVGKELVAHDLHHQSKRSKQPYLTLNCSAIPDSLLQSELFGHEAGAYTSADKAHKGIFETAGKGSVFLDEFGDISPLLQVSMLRVLEKMEIRPIGSNHTRKINCRFIIATNADLQKMVDEKNFRKDLYYRITQLEIQVKPLRERKKDIKTIAYHFLNLNRKSKKATLSNSLEEKLTNHIWDGNVRELRNEIEKVRMLNSDKSNYEISDFNFKKNSRKEAYKPTAKEVIEESQTTIILKEISEEEIFKKDIQLAWKIRARRNTAELRKERILNLFTNLDKVYRQEVAEILNVNPRTITKDFKELIQEKIIIKVEPTPSPRSIYFVLNKKNKL
ncbi:MAG: hypothetical protein COA79_07805 [Planctomycetota bacterium]|nr:MAG: hypothetical protein COA79_07805 [Planctomycetota bacterium]